MGESTALLAGSGVTYIEVRRNIILSCFFQCLKEGEVYGLMCSVYCVFCARP